MSPPTKMGERERPLDSDEVDALRCTGTARRIAPGYDGAVTASERVSHCDGHGYVYRYDIVRLLDDDRGGSFKYRAMLLLWTRDCEMFELATHPMYRLPDLTRNVL